MTSKGRPFKFTQAQREKLKAGECPGITGSGTCPLERGNVVPVASKLEIVVLRVDPKANGWKLHYEVRDKRDPVRLVRRTPPAVAPRPGESPDAEAIHRAGQESAYTSSPRSAVTDAGEAVDEKTQERFSKEGRERFGVHLERERKERRGKSLAERLEALESVAERRGVDVSRKLTSIERRIESAEREVGREDAT